MSRATPEEIAEEHAKYDRLTSAVTEALLTLPTKDLSSWNFRACLFKHLDKIITDLLESGNGHPNVSKFYLCLLLYRIVARLMEPIEKKDCGASEKECVRQAMKRYESVARKSAGKPEPDKPVKSPSIHNRPRAELSPDDLERVRKSQRERQARWRAKAKAEEAGNASGRAARNGQETC